MPFDRKTYMRKYNQNPSNRARKNALRKHPIARAKAEAWRTRHYQTSNRYRFSARRCAARAKGISWTVRYVDIVWSTHCPVLGIKLDYSYGSKGRGPKDNSPSLDRKNCRRGYVRGNVVVISQRANRIKNDARAWELRALAEWMDPK